MLRIVRGFCQPLPTDFKVLLSQLKKGRDFEVVELLATVYRPEEHSQYLVGEKRKNLQNEFQKYYNGRGRKDKIATIAWAIVKLGMQKDCKHLLNNFADRVENDEWYVNWDEAVRAMEAFHWLPPGNFRQQIYEKLERNVEKTIWQVNMKYYQRLTDALVKANRLESPLWQRLEMHILNNLSMEYSLHTIFKIYRNFVIAAKGSGQFYNALQLTIYRGHLFQRAFLLHGTVQHAYSSELLASLYKTFSLTKITMDAYLHTDFQKYLLNVLNHPQFTIYELAHVTDIIEAMRYFDYGDEVSKQSRERLFQKLRTMEGYINLPDIIRFYDKMSYYGYEIPERLKEDITDLAMNAITQGPKRLPQTLELYSYLLKNNSGQNAIFLRGVENWLQISARYFNNQEMKLLIGCMQQNKRNVQMKGLAIKIKAGSQALQEASNLPPLPKQ